MFVCVRLCTNACLFGSGFWFVYVSATRLCCCVLAFMCVCVRRVLCCFVLHGVVLSAPPTPQEAVPVFTFCQRPVSKGAVLHSGHCGQGICSATCSAQQAQRPTEWFCTAVTAAEASVAQPLLRRLSPRCKGGLTLRRAHAPERRSSHKAHWSSSQQPFSQ